MDISFLSFLLRHCFVRILDQTALENLGPFVLENNFYYFSVCRIKKSWSIENMEHFGEKWFFTWNKQKPFSSIKVVCSSFSLNSLPYLHQSIESIGSWPFQQVARLANGKQPLNALVDWTSPLIGTTDLSTIPTSWLTTTHCYSQSINKLEVIDCPSKTITIYWSRWLSHPVNNCLMVNKRWLSLHHQT